MFFFLIATLLKSATYEINFFKNFYSLYVGLLIMGKKLRRKKQRL